MASHDADTPWAAQQRKKLAGLVGKQQQSQVEAEDTPDPETAQLTKKKKKKKTG